MCLLTDRSRKNDIRVAGQMSRLCYWPWITRLRFQRQMVGPLNTEYDSGVTKYPKRFRATCTHFHRDVRELSVQNKSMDVLSMLDSSSTDGSDYFVNHLSSIQHADSFPIVWNVSEMSRN
jgi:hypothetical protein